MDESLTTITPEIAEQRGLRLEAPDRTAAVVQWVGSRGAIRPATDEEILLNRIGTRTQRAGRMAA